MLQAHISVLGTSLFCVLTASLLFGPTVFLSSLPNKVFQLHQTWRQHCGSLCKRVWTVCTLGSASTSVLSTVPILERAVSRVLGAKCLGDIFFHRSSVDLLYVLLIYLMIPNLIFTVAPRLGLQVDQDAVNSVTRGLVGNSSFAVLPDVPPLACFILTLAFQIVSSSADPRIL